MDMSTIDPSSDIKIKQYFEPMDLLLHIMRNSTKNIIDCIPMSIQTYINTKAEKNLNKTQSITSVISDVNNSFPSEIVEKISHWLLKKSSSDNMLPDQVIAARRIMLIVSFIEIKVPYSLETRKKNITKLVNSRKKDTREKQFKYTYCFALPDIRYTSLIIGPKGNGLKKLMHDFQNSDIKFMFETDMLILKFDDLESGLDMKFMIDNRFSQISKKIENDDKFNIKEDDIRLQVKKNKNKRNVNKNADVDTCIALKKHTKKIESNGEISDTKTKDSAAKTKATTI